MEHIASFTTTLMIQVTNTSSLREKYMVMWVNIVVVLTNITQWGYSYGTRSDEGKAIQNIVTDLTKIPTYLGLRRSSCYNCSSDTT